MLSLVSVVPVQWKYNDVVNVVSQRSTGWIGDEVSMKITNQRKFPSFFSIFSYQFHKILLQVFEINIF